MGTKERAKIVETIKLSKSFPGVKALSDFSFELHRGEVHCIVGENGAGKSTFIKLLTGAHKPDSGKIIIERKSFNYLDPHTSQELGIQAIYQENILVNPMSVAENVFIGNERRNRFGIINHRETISKTEKIIESLGIKLNPNTLVESLSIAERQFVEIVKALVLDPKILIMDEPTSMFNTKDAETVLKLVKDISSKGIGIIYISHNLKEVSKIADKITVLRDGKLVKSHDKTRKIS